MDSLLIFVAILLLNMEFHVVDKKVLALKDLWILGGANAISIKKILPES